MLSILLKMIRLNGFAWTTYVTLYVTIRKFSKDHRSEMLDHTIKKLEKKNNLPGMNCVELNKLIWNTWNWEKSYGEEWTKSEEWKQSLIDHVLMKYFSKGKNILEIGPGAGKWTPILQQLARQLILVDVSEKSIETCRKRFSSFQNISFYVNNGSDLHFLHNNSINYIWSFDAFVHIAPSDTFNYFKEFKRILKKHGLAIIHHPSNGGLNGGWRSNVTKEMINEYIKQNGLKLISQFNSWGSKKQFNVKYYNDMITIFEKP